METKNQNFMRNYYFNIILKCNAILLIAALFYGCNDVFEKKLEDQTICIVIPNDNDTLYTNEVHFKWEEMKGASHYNLQIVQPGFSNIQTFVLDSSIADDEFKFVLNPGLYQYKIRGENSAYQSAYSEARTIYIDSVNELTAQVVQLINPADNIYTNNQLGANFNWQNLFAADYYVFQLRGGSTFSGGGVIHEEPTIYGINYAYMPNSGIIEEGEYTWGIAGVNDNSSTVFSSRHFSVDTTSPGLATINSPANDVLSPTNNVTFKWTRPADQGVVNSPITARIEISYNDSAFNNTPLLVEANLEVDTFAFEFVNFQTTEYYWWRVFLDDEAGNTSNLYFQRKFKFQ